MKEAITILGGGFLGRSRLVGWARSGLLTTAAQALVQGLSFVAGILVVRWLSPHEYAFYTIATAGLGMMTVLTDGGIGSSVLALGGAVWQDHARFGAVIATGIRLRRRFSQFALVVGVPLMGVLLWRQGASVSESALVALSVVPLFLATVTGHLLEIVPRLRQDLLPLQRIQITANAGRLLLIVALVPIWPIAMLANLLAALPQWWANLRLRSMAARHADWRCPSDPQIAERIAAQVRRTMPAVVYYALSGQITVWLISLFGKSSGVAAIGALGRLAMILTVLGTVFSTVAVPRFARIPADDRMRVRRRYVQAQLIFAAVCSIPIGLIALLPGPSLAMLGPQYSGLGREAVLMGIASVAGLVCGAAYSLGAARGTIAPPALTLPSTILLQILLITSLPLGTVAGVLWIGILSAAGQWIVHFLYFEWHRRGKAVRLP